MNCCQCRGRLVKGDRHERLGRQQRGRALIFVKPAVNNVGVDAMGQGNPGHGRAALTAFLHDLGLELRAVIPSFGPRAINLVRPGVHDLHGAHGRFDLPSNQYDLGRRLPKTGSGRVSWWPTWTV